jgi:hypothetical protein
LFARRWWRRDIDGRRITLGQIDPAPKVIQRGVRVSLAGYNTVSIPHRASGIPDANLQWIGPPGSPIPWKSYSLSAATLGPAHKLAVGAGVTREMIEHGNGQEVVAQLLKEDASLSLDASMFSTAAASASRPAGLLFGLTPIVARDGWRL